MSLDKLAIHDVIILGAGAAGLMAALTAAKRGRKVLILEKSNKVGKKILMSGGGRCNFTNQFVNADNFLSHNSHFCKAALSRYSSQDFVSMVEKHNIEYEQRKHNQLFCLNSSKDILNMLLKECEEQGVEIKTHCELNFITTLDKNIEEYNTLYLDNKARFLIRGTQYSKQVFEEQCNSLVVATGGLSVPTLGGSSYGYNVAKQFSLLKKDTKPGLVPFTFDENFKIISDRLSGIAFEVIVECNKTSFRENLLFTHRGLSGPAILQISSYWNPGDHIIINLMPNENTYNLLINEKKYRKQILLRTCLIEKLPKAFVIEIQTLWWKDLAEKPLAEISDKKLKFIGDKINAWVLKPSATEGYRTAEVTLGGVDTDYLSSKTMEVKKQPGLYFIGEVIDVSGHLGGFNFQWAWASGYTAGLYI
jgi:hypothetical protein